MIRRTKSILDLPPREDRVIRLSFDIDEEQHYRSIEQPMVDLLHHDVTDHVGVTQNWTNAIQQINKLRLVCVLGTYSPSRLLEINKSPADSKLAMLAARVYAGGNFCEHCLQPLDSPGMDEELEVSAPATVYYSSCEKFFCSACATLLHYQTPRPRACSPRPPTCPLFPLSSGLRTPSLTPTDSLSPSSLNLDDNNVVQVSSKVRALVMQIHARPEEKQ